MTATLDDLNCNYTDNPRVRPAINTLLAYFPGSMLMNSNLTIVSVLETTTPMSHPCVKHINLMNMTL